MVALLGAGKGQLMRGDVTCSTAGARPPAIIAALCATRPRDEQAPRWGQALTVQYVSQLDTFLRRHPSNAAPGSSSLLLGAWLDVDMNAINAGFAPARTASGMTGFIEVARTSPTQQLKVFVVDVGQGDAALVEAEGAVVIIDGGPNSIFPEFLAARDAERRLLAAMVGENVGPLEINAIVVTHFDDDHYTGIKHVLTNANYRVGVLYHNGLPRYGEPAGKDMSLGTVTANAAGESVISTDLSDIQSARALLATADLNTASGNLNMFARFLQAAVDAHDAGRLNAMERLDRRAPNQPGPLLPNTGPDLGLEILGPIPAGLNPARLPCFPDPHGGGAPSESHTVNGNSVVLKLRYGQRTLLFGGDLNAPAQQYLLAAYADPTVFEADVNKACHHGSSDFELAYLKAVQPHATIFSSGDSGSYDHPLPDAMGAASKHSRGDFPLVFSTELAREGQRLGHINVRSNGTDVVVAQKKEKPSSVDPWHDYAVPYHGPFG